MDAAHTAKAGGFSLPGLRPSQAAGPWARRDRAAAGRAAAARRERPPPAPSPRAAAASGRSSPR